MREKVPGEWRSKNCGQRQVLDLGPPLFLQRWLPHFSAGSFPEPGYCSEDATYVQCTTDTAAIY